VASHLRGGKIAQMGQASSVPQKTKGRIDDDAAFD
jgi:hypothetical protein